MSEYIYPTREDFTDAEHAAFRASKAERRKHRAQSARNYIELGVMDKEEAKRIWNVTDKDLDNIK